MKYRRTVVKGLATGALSAYMVKLMAMGSHPPAPGLRSFKGTVLINGQPAREGQLVLTGDTIVTGKGSEAVYVMGNSAYLMREDSHVQFGSDAAVGILRVVTGKVLAVFGPGAKRIQMSTATAGIRGTACYIETGEAQTYFCLCYGTAELSPLADPGQARTVVTHYHDSPFYIGTDRSAPLFRPAAVLNHRDAELTLLEALVGRRPPFAGKDAPLY